MFPLPTCITASTIPAAPRLTACDLMNAPNEVMQPVWRSVFLSGMSGQVTIPMAPGELRQHDIGRDVTLKSSALAAIQSSDLPTPQQSNWG